MTERIVMEHSYVYTDIDYMTDVKVFQVPYLSVEDEGTELLDKIDAQDNNEVEEREEKTMIPIAPEDEVENAAVEKTQQCAMCGKLYGRRSNLIKHMLLVHDVCPDGGEANGGPEEKEIVTETIEIKDETDDVLADRYACEMCDMTYASVKNLKQHVTRVHKPTIQCTMCEHKFSDQANLRNHMLTMHIQGWESIECNKPTAVVECDQCYHICLTEEHLTEHKRLAHGARPCLKCDTVCLSKTDYLRHMKTHALEAIVCPDCDQSFKLSYHLENHMASYHRTPKNFDCDVCGLSYHSELYWFEHMQLHEEGREPHVCSICGKVISTKGNLRIHMARHRDEKKFQCSYCGKGFNTKAQLKWHEGRHLGTNKYVCQLCEQVFTTPASLNRHMKHHSGEKRCVCSTCGKRFFTVTALQYHEKVHTQEKNHVCECGRAFIARGELNYHKKKLCPLNRTNNPRPVRKAAPIVSGPATDNVLPIAEDHKRGIVVINLNLQMQSMDTFSG